MITKDDTFGRQDKTIHKSWGNWDAIDWYTVSDQPSGKVELMMDGGL